MAAICGKIVWIMFVTCETRSKVHWMKMSYENAIETEHLCIFFYGVR